MRILDVSPLLPLEFADEISHAVNAICGKPNANNMLQHAGYFANAANSTLIPYTKLERAALTKAMEVFPKFAQIFG